MKKNGKEPRMDADGRGYWAWRVVDGAAREWRVVFNLRRMGVLVALLVMTAGVLGQEPIPRNEENLSVRNEAGIAITKGLDWLRQHQNADGSWSLNDYPALTALPLWAYMGNPQGTTPTEKPDYIRKGYDFIVASARPDGGMTR